MSANKVSSRVERLELVMERSFHAPKDLVFSMFTEPDHLVRWWGPFDWETAVYKMDVKPGGTWHYCMRSPDGEEAWGKSIYQEIAPPNKLVYTDVFSDEQGNEVDGMPKMLITLFFSSEGSVCTIRSSTKFDSKEELQKVMDMQAVEGMSQTYDRLEAYLTKLQQSH